MSSRVRRTGNVRSKSEAAAHTPPRRHQERELECNAQAGSEEMYRGDARMHVQCGEMIEAKARHDWRE